MRCLRPTRRTARKALVLIITAILFATLAWFIKSYISLEELVTQEERVRSSIDLYPWRSLVIGLFVYIGLSLIPGTGGKAVVCGWLFGFWHAMVIVIVGLSSAAMVVFSLSRYLFREYIENRYSQFLSIMNRHIEREGAFYLLTLRMAHAPFSIINPVSGASRIRTWTFLWTTAVGLLPGTAIWAYVGIRLPSLSDLASDGPGSLIDLPLLGALVASGLLPLSFRWLVSHFGIPTRKQPDHGGTTTPTKRSKL